MSEQDEQPRNDRFSERPVTAFNNQVEEDDTSADVAINESANDPLTDSGALVRTSPDEFELRPEYDGIWLTVENISVRVRKTERGVRVACYPLNEECSNELAEIEVAFDEVAESITI